VGADCPQGRSLGRAGCSGQPFVGFPGCVKLGKLRRGGLAPSQLESHLGSPEVLDVLCSPPGGAHGACWSENLDKGHEWGRRGQGEWSGRYRLGVSLGLSPAPSESVAVPGFLVALRDELFVAGFCGRDPGGSPQGQQQQCRTSRTGLSSENTIVHTKPRLSSGFGEVTSPEEM
jgi:hypothetical protein